MKFPDHYRLMFLTPLAAIPKGQIIEKGNPTQDCYAYLRETLAEGIRDGRFRKGMGDADQLAQIFFAGVHGNLALHLIKGEDDWVKWRPIKNRARVMIRMLVDGLLLPSSLDNKQRRSKGATK
ncbi:MAG: hypothetical protein R3C03_08150 [Pirellulaceae bacterium]